MTVDDEGRNTTQHNNKNHITTHDTATLGKEEVEAEKEQEEKEEEEEEEEEEGEEEEEEARTRKTKQAI